MKNVPLSKSWAELQSRLRAEGVAVGFKNKGPTSQIEGIRFTMNNLSFNGSKVDRQFSYSKIDHQLRLNGLAKETHQEPQPIIDLGGIFNLHQNCTDNQEDEFRRRMQRKKKHQRRI